MSNDYAVVSVRTSSTRFPKKALEWVTNECRVLDVVIHRAKKIGTPIVVATSTDSADDVIVEIAATHNVPVFRGPLLNRIKRWKLCFDYYQIENAVLVDGDDLLYDYDIAQRAIEELNVSGVDMIRMDGSEIIIGFFGDAVTTHAVSKMYEFAAGDDVSTENITEFIKRAGLRTKKLQLNSWEMGREHRLTLDYPEDLEMFRALVAHVGINASGREIVSFLDSNQHISRINLHRQQDYVKRREQQRTATAHYLKPKVGE